MSDYKYSIEDYERIYKYSREPQPNFDLYILDMEYIYKDFSKWNDDLTDDELYEIIPWNQIDDYINKSNKKLKYFTIEIIDLEDEIGTYDTPYKIYMKFNEKYLNNRLSDLIEWDKKTPNECREIVTEEIREEIFNIEDNILPKFKEDFLFDKYTCKESYDYLDAYDILDEPMYDYGFGIH